MTNERAIPEGYMTVGEVAKKMGVTVRTLQYYDSNYMKNRKRRKCWKIKMPLFILLSFGIDKI